MRRTLVVFCSGGPYHVPTLARVALFPIHLDPPTRQHREMFRLLLGAPDLTTPSHTPQNPSNTTVGLSSSSAVLPPASPSGVKGRLQSLFQRRRGTSEVSSDGTAVGAAGGADAGRVTPPPASSSPSAPAFLDEDPISCGTSSPFWYMEAFATSLREDSQLAPFDDIILIPNTRGPVSLRQSTHLAALAVLAARGLAHVHVDFTALEHPDESMPIIYELVCKYTNSVLVHSLQDAYEMQNWSHFAEFKNTVPMMLLQTQSFPPRALERQRPLGSVSRLTSRQYHSPIGPYVRSPEEAGYYREAENFMNASVAMRRRNPSPMALTGGGSSGSLGADMRERYESATLVNRESDYFDDVPDVPPNRRRIDDADLSGSSSHVLSGGGSAAWEMNESDMMKGTPPPSGRARMAARASSLRGGDGETMGGSGGAPRNSSRSLLGGQRTTSSLSSSSSASPSTRVPHDRLGLSYADCARGRWWNTPGGRGDDEVELSRGYWSSTSSSWLGGGTGASSSLPDWMEDVGAVNAKHKHDRHILSDHTSTMNVSDPAASTEAELLVGGGGGADALMGGGDREVLDLDTVVSDDGFALAVDEQMNNGGGGEGSGSAKAENEARGEQTSGAAARVADADAGERSSTAATNVDGQAREVSTQDAASPQTSQDTDAGRAAARESADEDTRKRYLTSEIEDVRKMLDGMLRHSSNTAPTTTTTAASSSGAGARQASGSSGETPNSAGGAAGGAGAGAASSAAAKAAGKDEASSASSSTSSRPFGLYATHHHDVHSHTRRRHRCVRQLLEELFPPRVFGPVASASSTATTIGAMEDGIREYYSNPDPHDEGHNNGDSSSGHRGEQASSSGRRSVSSASIFNTAVKTTPSHLSMLKQAAALRRKGKDGVVAAPGVTTLGSINSDLYSWIDSPMVEVHPITRSTGADVRQALWEQEIHPSSILMDCVLRYIEGHGLYRDPRKATAASLYAGIGASEVGAASRAGSGGGAGGVGGATGLGSAGGPLGGAADVNSGFRDPAMAGSGSGGSSSSVGSTIMDGRTGVRRVAPRDTSTLSFPGLIPRLELHYDRNNLLAREQFEKLRLFQCQDGEEPDLIVPIGGDGYMMHCIRKNWRRFIPFYGVNAGHVGYLLNDRSTLEELFSSPLKLHFTTMLYCQAEKESDTGERMLLSELAFNDAWVERSSGQTALIRILVNGQERIRRLRGDGVLVSTAAGSTAYSQALGASPVPVGAPLIQVVGSNVVSPAQWRPAHLDQEDQVEFEVIDSTKRPCRCYVDSVDVGNVTRLLVRSSRVAGVTLAFSKSCDLQHKLYQMQFPKTL